MDDAMLCCALSSCINNDPHYECGAAADPRHLARGAMAQGWTGAHLLANRKAAAAKQEAPAAVPGLPVSHCVKQPQLHANLQVSTLISGLQAFQGQLSQRGVVQPATS